MTPPPSDTAKPWMTREALGDALQRLVDKAFANRGKKAPRFSIPATPDDDDLSLFAALDELQAARARIAELEGALRDIADSPHCIYPTSGGSYETGVVDGHRCAAASARKALAPAAEPESR